MPRQPVWSGSLQSLAELLVWAGLFAGAVVGVLNFGWGLVDFAATGRPDEGSQSASFVGVEIRGFYAGLTQLILEPLLSGLAGLVVAVLAYVPLTRIRIARIPPSSVPVGRATPVQVANAPSTR